jgi:hypothetical protein
MYDPVELTRQTAKIVCQHLARIHSALGDFEEEGLILYPAVAARLTKRGLTHLGGYLPRELPADQI